MIKNYVRGAEGPVLILAVAADLLTQSLMTAVYVAVGCGLAVILIGLVVALVMTSRSTRGR
jgi:ABC-type Fe3+ transport system permease subunit